MVKYSTTRCPLVPWTYERSWRAISENTGETRGFSQEELAHRAEMDRTYVSSLERCIYAASIDVVDRLARVLGVEAADLLQRPARSREARKDVSVGRMHWISR